MNAWSAALLLLIGVSGHHSDSPTLRCSALDEVDWKQDLVFDCLFENPGDVPLLVLMTDPVADGYVEDRDGWVPHSLGGRRMENLVRYSPAENGAVFQGGTAEMTVPLTREAMRRIVGVPGHASLRVKVVWRATEERSRRLGVHRLHVLLSFRYGVGLPKDSRSPSSDEYWKGCERELAELHSARLVDTVKVVVDDRPREWGDRLNVDSCLDRIGRELWGVVVSQQITIEIVTPDRFSDRDCDSPRVESRRSR